MKIYTSYFGNAKKLRERGILIISIALYNPRYLNIDGSLRQFNPTKEMLSESLSQYIPKYKEILKCVDVKKTMDELLKISGGKDVALCCYETPDKFCHRHIVANFLNEKGYEVKEFFEEKKEVQQKQLDLF
jgi:uncharacterized protein (DUF488 family)